MEILALIAAAVVAFITARMLFKVFFSDSDDLWECIRYSFTPDIISMFRGEFWEDYVKSAKLTIYLALVFGSAVLTYLGVASIGDDDESADPYDPMAEVRMARPRPSAQRADPY